MLPLHLCRHDENLGSGPSGVHSTVLSDFSDVETSASVGGGAATRHNSFPRVRFRTNATQVRVHYWADFDPESFLTVLVNGVFDQSFALTANGADNQADITLASGGAAGVNRTVEIWEGPQSEFDNPPTEAGIVTGGLLTSVQTLDGGMRMLARQTPTKRVVVYGDSISQGHPGQPYKSWIGLLRRDPTFLGQVTSYGAGGKSLYQDSLSPGLSTIASRLSDALSDVAGGGTEDLVIVIGTNDWSFAEDGGVANWQSELETLVDAVHASRPAAHVKLVGMLDRSDQDSTLQDRRDAMNTVATARPTWCTYYSANGVITPATDTVDGVHPNDAGYAKVKDFMLSTVLP